MRETVNIMEVARLRPDYMGFIFFDRSPRFVGSSFVLPSDFPSTIKKVGVFVDESVDRIRKLVDQYQLQYVQLHGSESPDVCKQLRSSGAGVIKVFSVDDDFDLTLTKPYEDVVDYFLFDTKGKFYGGNGRPFNWTMLEQYDHKIPFFLSGGLTPDNVQQALSAAVNMHALDVNSGVEVMPAVKDPGKIKQLQEKIAV
jgi:phosphoribosylanthranilate isomerase